MARLNGRNKKLKQDQLSFGKITNKDLVCADCRLRYNDTLLPCNTSKCEIYQVKPDQVLSGGNCDEYIKE